MRISDWSSDVCSSDLVAVHGDAEAAEVALGLHDGALEDRHVHHLRGHDLAGLAQQHGHVEPSGELLARLDGLLVAAVDDAEALGGDRKSTLLNFRHSRALRMPSSVCKKTDMPPTTRFSRLI